jgi:adenylosuccinate synthase
MDPPNQPLPNVVLSGPLCAGKTTVAEALTDRLGYHTVRVRELLRGLASTPLESRLDLQHFGNDLEGRTNGAWLRDALRAGEIHLNPCVVLDSVRTLGQRQAALDVLGGRSVHVHLTADRAALVERFHARADSSILEAPNFDAAMVLEIDVGLERLDEAADVVFQTTELSIDEVDDAVIDWLRCA